MDANRKKTGGKIELQINLREPLTGEDIVKKSERWLILDSFGSTVSQSLSSAGLTVGGPYIPSVNTPPVNKASPQPTSSPPPAQNSPMEIDTPKPESAPPPAVENIPDKKMNEVKEEGGELEQAEDEFNK